MGSQRVPSGLSTGMRGPEDAGQMPQNLTESSEHIVSHIFSSPGVRKGLEDPETNSQKPTEFKF